MDHSSFAYHASGTVHEIGGPPIIDVVQKRGLTHAAVAALAHTSRTRVTAIMSRNTKDISTDLMLRVLGALGVSAKVTFGRAA